MSKSIKKHFNPLLGGAMLAAGMMLAAPAAMAFGDTPGVDGRPSTPNPQPGVNAIQTAGDKVFDSGATIPGFLGGGPIALNDTGLGATYHGLYGYSTAGAAIAGNGQKPAQGLTVGVLNTFGTNYKVKCNIVVQVGCGSF